MPWALLTPTPEPTKVMLVYQYCYVRWQTRNWILETMYCTNCGEEVSEHDKFCPHCGEDIGAQAAASQTETTGQTASGQMGGSHQGPNETGGQRGHRDEPGMQTGQPGRGVDGVRSGPPSEQRQTIPRKDAWNTIQESLHWLLGIPVLIGAFIVVDVLDSLGQYYNPTLGLVSAIVGLLVGGVAYIYVDGEVRNREVEFERALSAVFDQILSLIGIFIIYLIAVVIGLILLVLPGIYLGARLILAFPACVLDGESAFDSLSTSWEFANGNVAKLVGIFLISILPLVGLAIVGTVFTVSGAITEPALYLLLAPISAIVTGTIEMATARVYIENRGAPPNPPTESW